MAQRGNDRAVIDALRRELERVDERVLQIAEATGAEAVELARSTTEQMRPPVRPGEGPRAAHPGGWADVTGVTAGSMRYTAEMIGPGRARLTLEAGGAAQYLERRGYWVFSGLFDGPVQTISARFARAVFGA